MAEEEFHFELRYPKLPTRVLTLIYTYKERNYYFAITEYDYTSLFKVSFHQIIKEEIKKHHKEESYATLDTIILLHIVDEKLIL